MQTIEPIIIKTRDNLEFLLSKNTVHFIPSHYPRIILQFDNLPESENENWSKRLNQSYYTCGCSEGAVFLFVGLIGYLIYLFFFLRGSVSYIHILVGLIFLFILSGIGKFFGILKGKIRLKFMVNNLLKIV